MLFGARLLSDRVQWKAAGVSPAATRAKLDECRPWPCLTSKAEVHTLRWILQSLNLLTEMAAVHVPLISEGPVLKWMIMSPYDQRASISHIHRIRHLAWRRQEDVAPSCHHNLAAALMQLVVQSSVVAARCQPMHHWAERGLFGC